MEIHYEKVFKKTDSMQRLELSKIKIFSYLRKNSCKVIFSSTIYDTKH